VTLRVSVHVKTFCSVSSGRKGRARRVGAGQVREAFVEVLYQFIHGAIGRIDARDACESKLLDQSILQRRVGSLDATLGLRRIGALRVDVQLAHRSAKLGVAIACTRLLGVDAEDAGLVAVERDRLAVPLEVGLGSLEVVERGLAVAISSPPWPRQQGNATRATSSHLLGLTRPRRSSCMAQESARPSVFNLRSGGGLHSSKQSWMDFSMDPMRKRCSCGTIDTGAVCSTCGLSLDSAPTLDSYDDIDNRAHDAIGFARRYIGALAIAIFRPGAFFDRSTVDAVRFCLVSFLLLQVALSISFQDSPITSYELPPIPQRIANGIGRFTPSDAPLLYLYFVIWGSAVVYVLLRLTFVKVRFKDVLAAFSVLNGGPVFVLLVVLCIMAAARDTVDHHVPIQDSAATLLFLGTPLVLLAYSVVALARSVHRSKVLCFAILLGAALVQVMAWTQTRERIFEVWQLGSGSGMTPAMSVEDHFLINRSIYRSRRPKAGEVVIWIDQKRTAWVARVVALPGETLRVGSQGVLVINDKPEPAWSAEFRGSPIKGSFVVKIPADHYGIMFDNRALAREKSTVYVIDRSAIRGKVYYRFLPIWRSGRLVP
jgi:signal peptidase I